jgi:hypothetical protein
MSSPSDRTLSMMEYEDWRSPAEKRVARIVEEFNFYLRQAGLQNIYPNSANQLQGIHQGDSLLDSLLGPGLL